MPSTPGATFDDSYKWYAPPREREFFIDNLLVRNHYHRAD